MASFYLDEPVSDSQAIPLRRRGHDVITTTQASNKGQSDVQQLLFATKTGRILITHDLRDYPMLHEAWHELAREWGVTVRTLHPGILILPPTSRLDIVQAAREMDAFVRREEIANRLVVWKVPAGWVEMT